MVHSWVNIRELGTPDRLFHELEEPLDEIRSSMKSRHDNCVSNNNDELACLRWAKAAREKARTDKRLEADAKRRMETAGKGTT